MSSSATFVISQKSLATSLLYAFGLRQPPSTWSLVYLYGVLGIDFVLTLARIPIMIFMIRDWFRRESSIKTTFFAFFFTWILIDLPRIGIYTGPVLFTGNGVDRIMNLLLIASYYDIYHLFAKASALVAFSWNRLAILGFGQSSGFNSEKNGPTCFLLVLMPLLPTVITSTVPPAYNPAPIFVFACLGLSIFFLACTMIASALRGFRFQPEKAGIEFRLFAFPFLLFITQLISVILQQGPISKLDWSESDTSAIVYSGIQLTYTLFMYHLPFLSIFALSPQLIKALLRNPFAFELPLKQQ